MEEIKPYFNPYSKIELLNINNLSDEDITTILHIKIKELSLNDIFIDDHNHYWSISKELVLQEQYKNPLTNGPFEENEWIRIKNAIEWYKNEINQDEILMKKYKNTQIIPTTQQSMNNLSNIVIPSNNNTIEITDIDILRSRNNCYITPLHGKFGNNYLCYPFCSYQRINNEYSCCYGKESIICNNKIISYEWSSLFCIEINKNINSNNFFSCYPLCCCGFNDELHTNCYFPDYGIFLCCGCFIYQGLYSFLGIFSMNCKNDRCNIYTPICCSFENFCLSPCVFWNKNICLSPIVCNINKICFLLGIPIMNNNH
jgi:hypothetical protein